MVALGGTSAQAGLLFSVFSLVAVVLRPMAGAWIDRQGVRRALVPGALIVVLASLGLQIAARPSPLIALMGGFGVGYGLVTMAAAVLAASAPAERRGQALSIYYLSAPVSMAVAAPLGIWLFREVGAGANFALVTLLGLVAGAFGLFLRSPAGGRAPLASGPARLWSPGAVPLSSVLVVAAMGQSVLYAFLPLHAAAHGQAQYLVWFFGLYSTAMIAFRVGVARLADRWSRSLVLMPALGLIAMGFGVLIAPPTAAQPGARGHPAGRRKLRALSDAGRPGRRPGAGPRARGGHGHGVGGVGPRDLPGSLVDRRRRRPRLSRRRVRGRHRAHRRRARRPRRCRAPKGPPARGVDADGPAFRAPGAK